MPSPASPSPQKTPILDIKHKLLHPALTSHYECYFPFPSSGDFANLLTANGISNTSDAIDSLRIFCSEAALPGSQLSTREYNNDYTGVTQRHAYRRLYDDRAEFTFYVDINYTPIRIFEAWMRFISGEQIATAAKLNNHYRTRFPKDYKTTIYITKFERSRHSRKPTGSSIVYSFFNAFPVAVASMPVSYDSSQLLKCSVSFAYDRYVQGPTGVAGEQGEPYTPTASGVPGTLTAERAAEINRVAYGGNVDFGINSNINTTNLYSNASPNQFNISSGTITDAYTNNEIRQYVDEERSMSQNSSTGEDPEETYARINFR